MKTKYPLVLALVLAWMCVIALIFGAEFSRATVSQEKSLYDRLGGAGGVRTIVDDFYDRVAEHPRIQFFRGGKYAKVDQDKLKKHLVDFIGSATGGPQKYTGRDMTSAHAAMKITAAEFEALTQELSATLDRHKIGHKEKLEILQIVSSTKAAIVSQ
ncbi:MAG: group 1 truncated hemoglobin [Bdellovibrionaceae bacterium]|nr:group 1 truncated hemoglobin [Pseudobdellovibrionaceae bacterium]